VIIILTSLSFITHGQPWPPADEDEKARLSEHVANRRLYNDLHAQVFPAYGKYLADKHDDDKKQAIILGWGEKATSNYVNLCIGEAPDVEVDGIDVVDERPDGEVLIDASRYGLGLYEVSGDGIVAQNPENCYMVVRPGYIRQVTHYVFFHEFLVGDHKHVKFTIHGRGFIQHLIYAIKDDKLDQQVPLEEVQSGVWSYPSFPAFSGLQLDAEGKQSTGVDDILIVRLDNKLSSERAYGRSDYTPSVKSLIEALERAFADRFELLRKFSRPVFAGPESAFNHFNFAKDRWELRLDEPLMLEPGSSEPKFISPNVAGLAYVEREIDDYMTQLLQMLDLVKQEELGKAESGTALAFRLLPTTSRVRKFATGLKKAIPKVLSLQSKLSVALEIPDAIAFEPSSVAVTMQDGIPRDARQEAEWATLAFQNGGMSLETYVSITQGLEMSDDPKSALQMEVARIKAARPAAIEEPEPVVLDDGMNGAT
jgi:hypothetical protein